METNTTTQLQTRLEDIVASEPNTIRAMVAKEASEYGSEDICSFFSDILSHGCVSGMVGPLIYYTDTHAFFDTHYNEIEELRQEYETLVGHPLHIDGDLKNFMAWFAFEETAWQIVNELDINY